MVLICDKCGMMIPQFPNQGKNGNKCKVGENLIRQLIPKVSYQPRRNIRTNKVCC